jgi:hypothetical protein
MKMKTNRKKTEIGKRKRESERGAALITALLISLLILAVGGALVATTTMTGTNAVDSTAEQQAYYAAEAGIQVTLNVLRGKDKPTNRPTFRSAIGDPCPLLNFSGNTIGGRPTAAIGNYAYSVKIDDPDNVAAGQEPQRLRIQSWGYGEHQAMKHLETIIVKTNFSFDPPSTLTMVGAANGDPMHFDLGASGAKTYSGQDNAASGTNKYAFAVTTGADQATAQTEITNKPDTIDTRAPGALSLVSGNQIPDFLRSADAARAFVESMRQTAIDTGSYHGGSPGDMYAFDGYAGSNTAPAFTFVDGNCNLDGGAGLLIVTGNLDMKGNPDFNGIILVLGEGTVNRDGGGNGNIYGAMVVASFDDTGNFTAPWFDTDGGGGSKLQYDSAKVSTALNTMGIGVRGTKEN